MSVWLSGISRYARKASAADEGDFNGDEAGPP
jgi:hypothetical protein